MPASSSPAPTSSAALAVLVAVVAVVGAWPSPFVQSVEAGAEHDFGTLVALADGDALPSLVVYPIEYCYFDVNADTTYDLGEPVYLRASGASCAGGVPLGAIRLTPAGGSAAGTRVFGSHSDFGLSLAGPLSTTLGYFDADGDAAFGGGDTLYWDHDTSGTVSVADVRLMPFGSKAAGTAVTSGDADLVLFLAGSPFAVGEIKFWDLDGDALFDVTEFAYMAAGFTARVGDVRITGGGFGAYGTMVDHLDLDHDPVLAVALGDVCYVDANANVAYDGGEPVYFVTGAAACVGVTTGSVRLTPSGIHAAGTRVRAAHADFDDPATAFSGTPFRFYDVDGTATFSPGDAVYVDHDASGLVSVGDVRITGYGPYAAGSVVFAADSDFAFAYYSTGWAEIDVGFHDLNGDAFLAQGDPVYLDVQGDDIVSVLDVRLGAPSIYTYASVVEAGDREARARTMALPGQTICFLDDDGDTARDPDEPVYVKTSSSLCSDSVQANDIRFTPSAYGSEGSKVRTADVDFGFALLTLAGGTLAFADADGDGTFGAGDTLYQDRAGDAVVSVGDIRSSGPLAGSTVGSADADLANALVLYGPSSLSFWDLDGSSTFSGPDILFLASPAVSFHAHVHDVRWTDTTVAAPPPTAPSAPLALDAQPTGSPGEIELLWDPPASDGGSAILSYNVYRGTSPGAGTFYDNVDPPVESYLDVGLGNGETYYYTVTAVNAVGEGPLSGEASATTSVQPPSPPRDLVARSGPGFGTVTLEWGPPASDGGSPVDFYVLYRGTTPDDLALYAEIPAPAEAYEDGGLADDETFYYALTAVNDAGESGPSNEAHASTYPTEPEPEPEDLPDGLASTSAVWEGHYAYVFGGLRENGPGLESSDEIVRFDPDTGDTLVLDTTLPEARHGTSAVWTNADGTLTQDCHPSCALGLGYIFGGARRESIVSSSLTQDCHPSCAVGVQILEYDPNSGEVRFMGAQFPHPVEGTSAVWVGDGALVEDCHPSCRTPHATYIFGGNSPLSSSLTQDCHPSCAVGVQIFQFIPSLDTIAQTDATLPSPRSYTSATWDGEFAYVFGGRAPDGSDLDEIVRYDPATDTISLMGATLPTPRAGTSAVFDGRYAYVFGGRSGDEPLADVLRYDPVADAVAVVGQLPDDRSETSAVFDGQTAYVFGGNEAGGPTDDIAAFTPGAPQNPQAQTQPSTPPGSHGTTHGKILVSWDPPVSSGLAPLTGYRVYRGTGAATGTLIAEVDAETLSFLDTDLAPGTAYFYRISAVNAVGEGPQSDLVGDVTTMRPGAPQNLRALPGGVGLVTVNWADPLDDGGEPVTKFRLFRATSGLSTGVAMIAEVTANQHTWVDAGCTVGHVCTYFAAAVNVHGQGPPSNSAATAGTKV